MKNGIFLFLFSIMTNLITIPANAAIQRRPDPAFNNLRFQYYVHSQRFILESKILTAFKHQRPSLATTDLGSQFHYAKLQKSINLPPHTSKTIIADPLFQG